MFGFLECLVWMYTGLSNAHDANLSIEYVYLGLVKDWFRMGPVRIYDLVECKKGE